ncbi:DUF2695 domain-containing protein [Amycolatopsis alkalitolerans]
MRTELVPAALREQWTKPLGRECLPCYLSRMLADFGCDDTMRWTLRWRDSRAPGVTSLDGRAPCDCRLPGVLSSPVEAPPPPCAGVRRGSTRPCRPTRHPPSPV